MGFGHLEGLTLNQLNQVFCKDCSKWVRCRIPANKGERITRIIPLNNPKQEIKNISQLSYCPRALLPEGKFNRCNLPKQEVFYGTLWGEDGDPIVNPIMTSIMETSQLCQLKSEEDEFYVAGEWIVAKELKALVLFDFEGIANNTFFKNAGAIPAGFLEKHPGEDFGDRAIIDAFSKPVQSNNDYLISAAYSNHIFEKRDIDAIIYPSIKTEYAGTCIAIRPSFVDSGGIELLYGSKYRLFKSGEKKVNGYPYQHGTVDTITGEIVFKDIPHP